ncbi:ABC-three component system protein [Archangium violaceum]|uniref:ABC-three component system protein n=1 Tax=Archangium violaceum TaxID=83451 RepID=UPI002B2B6747|nr:ABC-three component system protein [Archangium gephyra]
MSTDFSATSSALGYLYQVRYALYLLLERGQEAEVALETLDDVVFEAVGSPKDLLQLKHHANAPADLSDASPDLWKTLRVWSEQVAAGKILLPGFTLSLITTATAAEGSACALLRAEKRDPVAALARLESVPGKSKNKNLQKAFEAFLNLAPVQRELLVAAITIVDVSPSITDIPARIRRRIMYATRPEHLDSLYERLEGWWFANAVTQLATRPAPPIRHGEVQAKISDIADQLRSDSLPIDFLGAHPPSGVDPGTDDRIFVLQLRDLQIRTSRVERAIVDYYRAFEQRSRWVREELLLDEELTQYEDRLVDEWQRVSDALQDRLKEGGLEEELRQCGLNLYEWMELEAHVPIRSGVTEPYVLRGSYHMLADKNPPRVWWHPTFLARLNSILSQGKA